MYFHHLVYQALKVRRLTLELGKLCIRKEKFWSRLFYYVKKHPVLVDFKYIRQKLSEIPYIWSYLGPSGKKVRLLNLSSKLFLCDSMVFYCFSLKSTNEIKHNKFWAGFCISLLPQVGCIVYIELHVTSLVSHWLTSI